MYFDQFFVSPVIPEQTLHPYGHEIRFKFSLFNAADIQDWNLTKNFRTLCPISPTSWQLWITLKGSPDILYVSGIARIMRTDITDVDVAVFLSIKTSHPLFEHIPMDEVDNYTFKPLAATLHKNISNIVPSQHCNLLRGEISVLVHMYVRNCHPRIPKALCTPDEEPTMENCTFSKL